jgi:hypothetical protein
MKPQPGVYNILRKCSQVNMYGNDGTQKYNVHKEIQVKLNARNACYHAVPKIFELPFAVKKHR